jgi:hypothetical protein
MLLWWPIVVNGRQAGKRANLIAYNLTPNIPSSSFDSALPINLTEVLRTEHRVESGHYNVKTSFVLFCWLSRRLMNDVVNSEQSYSHPFGT